MQSGYAAGFATPNEEKRSRPIGDSMARRIERAFNKKENWLDSPHHSADETQINDEVAIYEYKESERKTGEELAKLPILTASQIPDFQAGKAVEAKDYFNPSPQMKASDRAFCYIETTNLMDPVWKPGTLYIVDPSKNDLRAGNAVLCMIESDGVVGFLERGIGSWYLSFVSKTQSPIKVDESQIIGAVEFIIGSTGSDFSW